MASESTRRSSLRNVVFFAVLVGSLGTGCATEKPLIENHQKRTTNPLLAKAKRPLERDLIETLEELRKRHRIPGLQVRVEKIDEPIFDVALGARSGDQQETVTLNDSWSLASQTEILTAVLIGQAIERTNLTWQSRVGQVLKNEIPERIPLHASTRAITVDQLLSHQAGLLSPSKIRGGELWAASKRSDLPMQDIRLRLARGILASPLEFAPGTRTAYSESAYIVLGHIAEIVFQSPWEKLVQNRIFTPLAMKSCGFVATGTVHCSAQDWAKFLRIFFDDGDSRTWRAKILRKDTLDHLIASAGNGMTFMSMQKIDRRSWAKGPVYLMAGNGATNHSISAVAPKASLAITINTNFGGRDAEIGTQEILKLLESRIDN